MKLHRTAKTTPSSRFALVQRALAGEEYAAIAAGMNISVRTVAKWVQRFRRGGVAGLEDRSSRPQRTPHQTPPGAIALIRQLREQHGLPAWAIGRALRIPRSTVGAWLRRLGLNRLVSAPPTPVHRYEWPSGATCCTSTSSRSRGLRAWGIVSMAIVAPA
jgi:transposase